VLNAVTPSYSDKINFYKVDIEEEPQMASLFRVMSVPQLSMIRKDGRREQSIGGMGADQLKYWLDGLIS
tara:strand:+ start:612 stop:818 length:207 start_codon:yes stop_codon:yes gene_type:complete